MRESDSELTQLTGYAAKTLYNSHTSGRGPLAVILCKLGGRLGAWRADYDQWLVSQRKLGRTNRAAA